MLTLRIKNLCIPMKLGIYDYELEVERLIEFNLSIQYKMDLKNEISINYDELVKRINNAFCDSKYGLIEFVILDAKGIISEYLQSLKINAICELEVIKTDTHKNLNAVSISYNWEV